MFLVSNRVRQLNLNYVFNVKNGSPEYMQGHFNSIVTYT